MVNAPNTLPTPTDRHRVLAVTSELPWPLDSGGHIRSFYLMRGLARRFDTTVATGVARIDAPGVAALSAEGIRVRPVPLPPTRRAVEAFRMARAAVAQKAYVLYARHDRREMRRVVREEARRLSPRFLYLDHLDSLPFARVADGVPAVIDCHNVYSTLLRREACESHRGLARFYLLREARLLEGAERDAARSTKVLFAVSAEDARVFRSFGARNVFVVPNGVDCGVYKGLPDMRRGDPPVILYVGAMSWAPNASAAVFLAQAVLPDVRKQFPGVRLRIVGRNPPAAVRQLASLPGVEVAGGVPDVRPHLAEARLLAVPLEAGGGSRLKILEAFAAGLPVVSTAVGCEGLEVADREHLLVAERRLMADAITSLLRTPSLADELAGRARTLARSRYDWTSISTTAADILESMLRSEA